MNLTYHSVSCACNDCISQDIYLPSADAATFDRRDDQ